MRSKFKRILYYGTVFWRVNFYLFMIVILNLGGDAISGYVKNEAYFVEYMGVYTEVPRMLWYVNYMQSIFVICLAPIPFIYGFISAKNKLY